VLSIDPEANFLPSGLKAIENTLALCPICSKSSGRSDWGDEIVALRMRAMIDIPAQVPFLIAVPSFSFSAHFWSVMIVQ
jgi:hypothetical protein